jgi:hypothetical protein
MTATPSKITLKVLRWTARILSLLLIGVFLIFAIGEGFTFWRFTPKVLVLSLFFPFGVVIGMALGWWSELAGGLASVGSLLGFYGVHFLQTSDLPGGMLPIFAIPGCLFILAGVVSRRRVTIATQ